MAINIGEKLVVLSANCQGLRDKKKRVDVLNYLRDKNPAILCLQDTHWVSSDEKYIRTLWNNEVIIHGVKTNARGVAILFGNNFEYKIHTIDKDAEGNLITVNMKISDIELKLINIYYAPNSDNP